MKKFLFLMLITLASLSLKAQVSFNQTDYNTTGVVANTASDTMSYTLTMPYKLVSVQVAVAKNAGTVAGTASIFYSVNGVNWISAGTALTLTDVTTNSQIWNVQSGARFWRIIVTGSGTMNVTASAKLSAS